MSNKQDRRKSTSRTNGRKNKGTAKKKKRSLTMLLGLAVLLLVLIAAGSQIVLLTKKNNELEARKQRLQELLESENLRQTQLRDEEAYAKTVEFIEKKAKSIGYIYPDEIIFRQEDD